METTRKVPDYVIESLVDRYCLPADSGNAVRKMLETLSHDDALEELQVFAGNCYRFDPNHPRYDVNRNLYPRV